MAMHSRVRSPLTYGLMALALSAPTIARGAGMEVPENGAYVLARGGTSAAMTGTAYALQFNPAGLMDVENMDIRLDVRLVSHDVSFQRDPRADGTTFASVKNAGGVFLGPGVMGAYHPRSELLKNFVFGFGIFGPPGVGKYSYPDPRNMDVSVESAQNSPQRYSLISNSNAILFPTLGVAWSPIKEFGLGITLQSAYASVEFAQAIAGKSLGGLETVQTDAVATLKMKDAFTPTFTFGAIYRPIQGLSIGATFKPPVTIEAKGTFDIKTAEGTDFTQLSNDATLKLNLASQTRVGVAYNWSRFSVAVEGVMQGWSAYKELVVDGSNVKFKLNGEEGSVGVKHLPKNWQDSYGARVGFSAWILDKKPGAVGLQGHAGALYETSAIPTKSQAIDTVNGDRAGISLGATGYYGDFSATIGGMYYPQVTITAHDSEAKRSVADSKDPDDPAVIVGNGVYTSSIWIAAIGLAYTPGKASK